MLTGEKNLTDKAGSSSGKSPVIPGWDKLIHLTDENYKSVFKDHKEVFVMFHAKWCGHCSFLKPIFVELVTNADNSTFNSKPDDNSSKSSVVALAACDTDSAPTLVDEFQLVSLPVFKYVRNGEAIKEFGGERTKDGFKEFLKGMNEGK